LGREVANRRYSTVLRADVGPRNNNTANMGAGSSLVATPMGYRANGLLPSPEGAMFKLAVVQFKVPGAKNGGSDKGPDGNRIDSIPIANSVIKAGGACDLILFDSDKNIHDVKEFEALTAKYDALIVRIYPGQLSLGTADGTQARFDDLMNSYIAKGKLIWSSPKIQMQMGAKDALVHIRSLNCGLKDTFSYYTEEELITGFKKTCAFQPRVLKQNRGSAGEGIWLCWLWDKAKNQKIEIYPSAAFGDKSLGNDDYVKLMEMNDNHVEFHTVKEFMIFCIEGPTGVGAGEWKSTFPGQYLKGGKAAHGMLVDQRLLPRIDEGEVRILMAGDTCQMAIHKKPMAYSLSAVGGMSDYTYYRPSDKKYQNLIQKLYADIPTFLPSLHLEGEPLPLLWTCDYIPKNPDNWPYGPYARNCPDEKTEYTVGEFKCSCVGISKFQAVCGGEKTLADVPDEDYFDACQLTDLMGVKAIEMLEMANKGKKPAEKAEAGGDLRRRATALGLLQVLTTADIADDATFKKAIAWCDEQGATSVSDIVEYNMVDDFVSQLGLKPIPGKKLRTMLQALTTASSSSSSSSSPTEGMECSFWFINADNLRRAGKPSLPMMQTLRTQEPHRLVQKMIGFIEGIKGAYKNILVVSHRWETPTDPDPTGAQALAVQAYLKAHPEIDAVWFDFSSMPQGQKKTERESAEFKEMLPNINLLYLTCSVLILMDRTYMSRFWTQFEAYLSMRAITSEGLTNAQDPMARVTIKTADDP
jgi:hypothetical protein